MQQLAYSPSQRHRPIPYGLVSLWDMINFCLHQFVLAIDLLDQEIHLTAKREQYANVSDDDLARLYGNLQSISLSVNKFGNLADGRIGTVWAIARKALVVPNARLLHELVALRDDVKRECEFERFYHYSRDRGAMLLRVHGDWSATIKAFPSAKEDISAAVDCYALGHNHASIHHSMMVLEFGLPALANRLRVKFNPNKATWKDITRGISDRVAEERSAMSHAAKGSKPLSRPAAKRKSSYLDDCEEAAIEFRYFANVWRNHIAHGRADYDDNDAKKVLEHVRTFMEVISTKLKLKEAKKKS